MYTLALHCTLSLFPLSLHYHLFFRMDLVSYVYISTSQKSDSHLVDPRLFLWTRLLALTYLSKPRRTRRCLLCLRRNRSVVLFCSGTMLQGHWFPKAGSLFWHADSFKLCLTEQPGQLIIWLACGMMLYHRQRREKDLSHVCSSYPIRQPWNCYHAHDSVFSPRNKNLLP